MYGYVYITTCTVNNKQYIGSHKYDKQELDFKYIGSGKTLAKAIKKYGRNNFKCKVLEFCETRDELIEKERYYISLYNAVISENFYNIDDGRGNSHTYITDEITKQKLSERQKQHITIHNDIEEIVINKQDLDQYISNGYKLGRMSHDYSIRIQKFKNTHYSDEYEQKRNKWKQNISKSVFGRRWVTNEIIDKQVLPEEAQQLVNNGWRYGRVTACGKKK